MAALVDAYAMQAIWTTWKSESRHGGKPTKVPYAIDGQPAKSNDPSSWMTYFEAQKAVTDFGHGGINVMLWRVEPDLQLGGIDLDQCLADDGALAPWAADIVVLLDSYTEVTPSGHGLRIFFLHDPDITLDPKHLWRAHVQKPNPAGGKDIGIEQYLKLGRPLSVTDNIYGSYTTIRTIGLDKLYAVRLAMARFDAGEQPQQMSDTDRLYTAIDAMENSGLAWTDWNTVGMAIHRVTEGSQRGYDAFLRWSQKSTKFKIGECRERWENWRVSPGNQVGEGTIFHHALQAGWKDPAPRRQRPRLVRTNGHDHDDVPEAQQFRPETRAKNKIREPAVAHIRPLAEFLAEYKPLQFAIDNLLPKGQLTALTAKTGDGKTTLAVYLAGHKANGRAFNGLDTPKGEVLYALIENVIGTQHQMITMRENWRLNTGEEFDSTRFHVLTISAKMTVPEIAANIRQYAEHIADLDLVFVDTGPALFPGDEENDNVQQGDYARDLRRLCELPGGPAVVVLCHPSKAAFRAIDLLPRGGSAFYFELDNNLTLWRSDEIVDVSFTKLRMPPFENFQFKLVPIEARQTKDAEGRLLRSVHLAPVTDQERISAANRLSGDIDRIITVMFQSTTLYWISAKGIGEAAVLLPHESSDKYKGSVRRVQRLIKDLVRDKLIEESGKRFLLTKKGEKRAASLGLVREPDPKV